MVQHPGPDGLLSTDSDRQVLERPAWTLRSGLFEVNGFPKNSASTFEYRQRQFCVGIVSRIRGSNCVEVNYN